MSEANVTIRGAVAGHISVAFHQNAVPIVHEVAVANGGEADLVDVRVTIAGDPGFVAPLTICIERIAAGATHHIRTPDLALDAGFLRNIAEGLRGSLAMAVFAGEMAVAQDAVAVELLPPSHWGGSGAAPELLAAFVRPNDPAVDTLLHDAAAKLAAAGKSAAIDGYAGGTRQRAWELASAIWSAVAARGITYVMPPASFERTGQKVRGPSDVLERKVATCLDSTLLFAACLLQRSSVRSGFRLTVHEDEPRFNPTLLQMLRQDYGLAIPELERERPSDDTSIDVGRVWQIVRARIRDLKGWEVTPDVVLSTFSFTKFLMWKDLVERMDLLYRFIIDAVEELSDCTEIVITGAHQGLCANA